MTSAQEHDQKLVSSFLLPARQDRYLELFEGPKRRNEIPSSLAHFRHLDMRYVVRIAPRDQHSSNILGILTLKGAPHTCCVISEDSELDREAILLAEALNEVVRYGMGRILSCIPGKLGYFEDEDQRWVLERRS